MGQNTFLEVSSTYFHMHWPSTWADEFNALPASQQHPATFNITTGIYIDGPEPTGQRFRDAYRHQTNIGVTRYIDGFLGASHQLKTGFENWWTPTGHRRLRDLRRRPPALHRPGERPAAHRPHGLRRVGSVPLQHAADAEDEDANFAAFVQDRASYRRVTLNLGLRWSYFDGSIPAQSNGGAEWGAACAACNQSFPEIKPPYQLEHVRAAHRRRLQVDGRRQERREGELQPLLRVDVHDRVRQHQRRTSITTGGSRRTRGPAAI